MARIMIVDDSSIMRIKLRTLLMKAGHVVVSEVNNGISAYNEYPKCMPDLITMDVTMPEMNGVEAVKWITGKYPDAKVIMISALEHKSMVLAALESGALHYIVKPFRDEEVISRIEQVLSESKSHQIMERPLNSEAYFSNLTMDNQFFIENRNGVFLIKINPYIDSNELDLISTTIKGLLFVKPLKFIFDFDNSEYFNNYSFNKIKEIFSSITSVNGELKIVSQNYNFIEFIKEKSIGIKPENVYSNIFEVRF